MVENGRLNSHCTFLKFYSSVTACLHTAPPTYSWILNEPLTHYEINYFHQHYYRIVNRLSNKILRKTGLSTLFHSSNVSSSRSFLKPYIKIVSKQIFCRINCFQHMFMIKSLSKSPDNQVGKNHFCFYPWHIWTIFLRLLLVFLQESKRNFILHRYMKFKK